jgi:hypothetical protein
MELLNERSSEISAKLAQLKQRKHFKTFFPTNTFLGITGFLTSISIRLIRKPFRKGLAEFPEIATNNCGIRPTPESLSSNLIYVGIIEYFGHRRN